MKNVIFAVLALSLAWPTMAQDAAKKEKKRLVFKLMLDVPTAAPAGTNYDPRSFGYQRSVRDGFKDFLSDFFVNPYVPEPGAVHVQPPYIIDWGEFGSVSGWSRSVRYLPGDDIYLASGQSAQRWQTGIPLGASLDFRPQGRTWMSLGWQMSATTNVYQEYWRDTLHITQLEQTHSRYVPSTNFFAILHRNRETGTASYALTSNYVSVAFKYDLLPNLSFVSIMPTAGGRLWLLREAVARETKHYEFRRGFYPERRDQSAEDALSGAMNVTRSERVDYQETIQWFAGLNGEVYPWGKDSVFGIGAHAFYIFDHEDVTTPDGRFRFQTPGWNVSAQAILAF